MLCLITQVRKRKRKKAKRGKNNANAQKKENGRQEERRNETLSYC
jgi:hypothetical protein